MSALSGKQGFSVVTDTDAVGSIEVVTEVAGGNVVLCSNAVDIAGDIAPVPAEVVEAPCFSAAAQSSLATPGRIHVQKQTPLHPVKSSTTT